MTSLTGRKQVAGRISGGIAGMDVVRADEEQVRRLGVSGVPCFVVNGRVALSGAQPPGLFLQAFEQTCEVDPTTGKRGC